MCILLKCIDRHQNDMARQIAPHLKHITLQAHINIIIICIITKPTNIPLSK